MGLLPSPPQTPGAISVPFGGSVQNQALNPAYGTTPYPVNPMLQAANSMNQFVQQVVLNKRQEQDYYKQKFMDGIMQIQAGIPLDHKEVLKWGKKAGIPLQTEEPLAMPVGPSAMSPLPQQAAVSPTAGMPATSMPAQPLPPGVNATPAVGGIAAPLEQQSIMQKLGLQNYNPNVSVNSPGAAFLAQLQHQAQMDAASRELKSHLDTHMGHQKEKMLNILDDVMDPSRTSPEKKNLAAELKMIELTGIDNIEQLANMRDHNPNVAVKNAADMILRKDLYAQKATLVKENWKNFINPKTGNADPAMAERYFAAEVMMVPGKDRDLIMAANAPTRSFDEQMKMLEAENKASDNYPLMPRAFIPSVTNAMLHPERPESQKIMQFVDSTFKSADRIKYETEQKRLGIDESNLYLRQREFESNLWVNANRMTQEAAKAMRGALGDKFENAWRLYQIKGVEDETKNAAMRDMVDALNKQNIAFSAPIMKKDARGNTIGVELGQPVAVAGGDWTVKNVEGIFSWLGAQPDKVIGLRNGTQPKTWPLKAVQSLAAPAKYFGGVTSATEFHKFLVKMYPEIDSLPATIKDQIVKQAHEVFSRNFWMSGQPEPEI